MAGLEEAARKLFPSMKERKGISGGQSMAPAITPKKLKEVEEKLSKKNFGGLFKKELQELVTFLKETDANNLTDSEPKTSRGTNWSALPRTEYGNYWETKRPTIRRLEDKADRTEEEEVFLRLYQEALRRRTGS